MRKRIGFIALLVWTGAAWAGASTEQQVRDLFQVMRMDQTLGQMNSQMAALMQKKLPCVSSDYWQGFMDSSGSKVVIDRMVLVYQRHFTAEEIDGLLAFYRSPLGQKVVTEMPLAIAEATQAGQQWGQERTRGMLAELQKRGAIDAEDRCPGPADASSDAAASRASQAVPASPASARHTRHGKSSKHRLVHKAAPATAGKPSATKATASSGSAKPVVKSKSTGQAETKAKVTPANEHAFKAVSGAAQSSGATQGGGTKPSGSSGGN